MCWSLSHLDVTVDDFGLIGPRANWDLTLVKRPDESLKQKGKLTLDLTKYFKKVNDLWVMHEYVEPCHFCCLSTCEAVTYRTGLDEGFDDVSCRNDMLPN